MMARHIKRISTIRPELAPNLIWVLIEDDQGTTGLGETYYIPGAVDSVIHDMAAPLLLGTDPTKIADIGHTLFACANFYGSAGAEMRAFSAIDVALWDLAGHSSGRSIATLLGGRTREQIRAYATCVDAPPRADQTAWLEDAGALALDLRAQGFGAMKVWPWDRFAPQISSLASTGPAGWSAMGPVGHDLPPVEMKAGLRVLEQIREAVGDSMQIMIEGHSRWDLNAAIRICRQLEEFEIGWCEDLIQPVSASDLARLANETRVPHAVSERLISRHAYREVLERGAAHVVMLDVVWTGGLTEARVIGDMAAAYHLPVAPHDCTGPVSLAASLQLCAHLQNATVMEVVRGMLEGQYRALVDPAFVIEDGNILIPDAPGHGVAIKPEFAAGTGAQVRESVYGR
jgi:L-alanine-DL-glutamate epimerase-like enolase superfamily enzyme